MKQQPRPKIPPNPKDLFAALEQQSPPVKDTSKVVKPPVSKPSKAVGDFRPRNTISIGATATVPAVAVPGVKPTGLRRVKKVKTKAKIPVAAKEKVKKKPRRKVVVTPDLKAVMVSILQQVVNKTPVKISSVERKRVRTLLTILGA